MKNYILLLAVLFAGIANAQSNFKVQDFSRIMIDTNAEVEIINSSDSKVMMNLSDNMLENIQVTSKNGALIIKQTSGKSPDGLRIRIYTSSIKALSVKSDSDVVFKNFGSQKSLVVQTAGKSTVDAGELRVEVLNIMRTADSRVNVKNAKNTKESIDGVIVATN